MNILQNIFKDHYEEIEYLLHPRAVVMNNIDKMINCGDPSFGGAMYGPTVAILSLYLSVATPSFALPVELNTL